MCTYCVCVRDVPQCSANRSPGMSSFVIVIGDVCTKHIRDSIRLKVKVVIDVCVCLCVSSTLVDQCLTLQ